MRRRRRFFNCIWKNSVEENIWEQPLVANSVASSTATWFCTKVKSLDCFYRLLVNQQAIQFLKSLSFDGHQLRLHFGVPKVMQKTSVLKCSKNVQKNVSPKGRHETQITSWGSTAHNTTSCTTRMSVPRGATITEFSLYHDIIFRSICLSSNFNY